MSRVKNVGATAGTALLDASVLATRADNLRATYPNGSGSQMGSTWSMVDVTVIRLMIDLRDAGSLVHLALETNHDHSLYAGKVCGLIVFDGREASVVPMSISPALARLNGRPIYLAHPGAAVSLMYSIVRAAEAAIEAAHVQP